MIGLREKKKARTRDEIIESALSLFETQGFETTTIEQIADRAMVAPRTIFRYFASKEDLVFLGQDEENRRTVALAQSVSRDLDPISAMMKVTRELMFSSESTSRHFIRSHMIIEQTPSLQAHKGKLLRQIETVIAQALGWRGKSSDKLESRLLIAVYVAALDTVMTSWIAAGAKGTPKKQLALVEALLRRAFPDLSGTSQQ